LEKFFPSDTVRPFEMIALSGTATKRSQLLARIFSEGVPKLWCPALTHYDCEGKVDAQRIAAHLRHMSQHVRGFLIPGSTGDGWELSDGEARELIEIALDQAQKLELHLLIGALKPDVDSMLKVIRDTIDLLKSRTGESDIEKSLSKSCVCGFAICPPRGNEISQKEMEKALESILKSGVPIALYQLPQVTQNEMGAELVSNLAASFENFFMFKDTSGTDAVIQSGKDLGGVFMVRGAERDYAKWLKPAGGRYDGFLLSTANCFAKELRQMMTDLEEGRVDAANKESQRLTGVISDVFDLVSSFPDGNPFANANKAMDQYFAYGPKAATVLPPRLHAGSSLPVEMIVETGKILERYGLMPSKGYLV
jgi:dihydrodipicolinate synthase/N-acetylneuraminate lyase